VLNLAFRLVLSVATGAKGEFHKMTIRAAKSRGGAVGIARRGQPQCQELEAGSWDKCALGGARMRDGVGRSVELAGLVRRTQCREG
jgi:hypothetical protein